jgi:hypothetical protein
MAEEAPVTVMPKGLVARRECICTKCWEQAISKCPGCRGVTTDRHHLYNLYTIRIEKGHLSIAAPVYPDENGAAESIGALFELRKLEVAPSPRHPSWQQLTCDHTWAFTPGNKSQISCKCGVPTLQAAL